jgi:prolycopene isomerase
MLARHVGDPQLRTVLGGLWGYMGLPPSRCAALMGGVITGSYHQHGGWYPEGGAQAITTALADELRDRRSEIRCGQTVTGFDVEGDRVLAVTTDQGLCVEADVFISNASAPTTLLELVGREHLPGDYVERVEKPSPSYTTFSVYLGLDQSELGQQAGAHEWFLNASWDADEAWQAAQSGDWDRVALSVTDYAHFDPGCAPLGHGVVVLTTVASWDYQNVWGTGGDLTDYHANPAYLRIKEQVADALIRRADDPAARVTRRTHPVPGGLDTLHELPLHPQPARCDRRLREHPSQLRPGLASSRDTDHQPLSRRCLDQQRRNESGHQLRNGSGPADPDKIANPGVSVGARRR